MRITMYCEFENVHVRKSFTKGSRLSTCSSSMVDALCKRQEFKDQGRARKLIAYC